MKHCVGGYAERCMKGDNYIISVISASGARATMELRNKSNEAEQFYIHQNRTYNNQEPSLEIKEASKQFEAKINSGRLNPQRGSLRPEKNLTEDRDKLLAAAHEIYPYRFNDMQTQEAIYQVYKKTQSLPSMLIASSYAEALKKSKLDVFIKEKIDALAMELRSPTLRA